MLPSWWKADDLRQQLRTHLTTTYTDETWTVRVPPQLGENLSVVDQHLDGLLIEDRSRYVLRL
jgi:hypothetical protein